MLLFLIICFWGIALLTFCYIIYRFYYLNKKNEQLKRVELSETEIKDLFDNPDKFNSIINKHTKESYGTKEKKK